MPDIFDPGGLTDWWDVPADYFTGGMDLSGGMDLDPSLYSLSDPGYGIGSLDWLGDSGFGSTGGFGMDLGLDTQWLDTLTGQVLSLADVQKIDPSFDWQNAAKMAIGGATALGGLGALGLGIGSLFGGSDAANRTQTQTSAAGQGPRSPEAMQLLGSGGGAPGLSGAAGGGGTGLLGLSNMMVRNLMGSGQGGAPGGASGLGQATPGAQPGQSFPGQLDAMGNPARAAGGLPMTAQQLQALSMGGGPGAISAPGGSTNFNEQTGMYAPGTGPLWAQAGGAQLPPGSRDPNVAFAPAVRQWNESTGQYGYNPGYGPSPGGGAMALPQAQPQTWPAVPGSGGGYLSAPSGGGQAYGGQPQQASGQQAQAGQGLIGQQANVLGGLQSQIPQLNPAIMQALGMQAQGMAQGYLPSLSDPQAQARIQSIYQPGFDALNYNSGLALSNAREQLQQRGFAAPDIREGPTQALTAPILAAQQLGRSQLYGQMAGAQLDLASRLPMLGSQLNAQNYSTQAQPFNLGMGLAGAYNQPIATQGQFPLSLLDILERGRGSTSTINTVGPQPSLTQQLGQIAPIIGAGGGLLSSAGNALFPQSQNPYGVPRYDPFTGRSLSGI